MISEPLTTNDFDRNKPFYSLIVHFVVQVFGFKDKVANSLIGTPNPDIEYLENADVSCFDEGIISARDQMLAVLGSLPLHSEQYKSDVIVGAETVSQAVSDNPGSLEQFQVTAASNLLLLANELTTHETYYDRENPIWQFLRHCRNATAHGGNFNITSEEITPAKWRDMEITVQMHGTPMFKRDDGVGLLSPGDAIHLLWDLEQTIP